ncbi:MAG: cytochrome oxidase subunit [Massilia sp.]|nr:cytochrome oxidase subunit [Massilia sp.]
MDHTDNKNELLAQQQRQTRTGRWKLFAVLAVCAAPLIFSYLTYYVIKPTGRTNYGELIDPRAHPIPVLGATSLDGKPTELTAWQGKWLMLKAGPSACAKPCMDQMFAMRQLRAMQGKEMERIERVWLITDQAPLETVLIRELDGMRMLRASAAAVSGWLPHTAGAPLESSIYLIDPLGHLMMRFPPPPAGATEAQAVEHYAKIKKDIAKVLKASAIG